MRALFIYPFFLFSILLSANDFQSRIIHGAPVPMGMFQEVIAIKAGDAGCTATVVGPRVILTAAHCAKTGTEATFKIKDKKYSATVYRNALYPSSDLDVAVAITKKNIVGIRPVTISGAAEIGQKVLMLGYGCTQPGGGPTDHILRMGESTIEDFHEYDLVSKEFEGAAHCFGDSGGPTYIWNQGRYTQVAIASKGNIMDTNYSARLDIQVSQDFLKQIAADKDVTICGINLDCSDFVIPPPPLAVNFQKPKFNFLVSAGSPLVISLDRLLSSGSELDLFWFTGPKTPHYVTIDQNERRMLIDVERPIEAVTFALVTRDNNTSASTLISLQPDAVTPPPPPAPPVNCRLRATPSTIALGQSTVITMKTSGEVHETKINGELVSPQVGLVITPSTYGEFSAQGEAIGPTESASCEVSYKVARQG